MAEPLRVLLVEDSADDAVLLEREVRRAGFDVSLTRVETEAQFLSAMSRPWDVVIADYVLPRFTALGVLRHLRHLHLDIPTIVVSGTVTEGELVDAMKAGAHDYVQKENLSRLVPAIRREIGDAALRRRHRESEDALKEAQERFRFVVENTADVVYRVRFPDMVYDYISPGIERLTGYGPREFNGVGLDKLVVTITDPAGKPIPREDLGWVRHIDRSGEFAADYQIRTKSGTLRWLADHSFPWRDSQGRLVGAVGTLVDVSDRKRAEAALRRSEEYFRSLIENASDPIVVFDQAGTILYESPALERVLGWRPEERVGRSVLELLPDDERSEVSRRLQRIMTEPGGTDLVETRVRHRDGSWRDVEAVAKSHRDEDGRVTVILNVRDLTERKNLEAQLSQAQKMEAIGRLAGGVAHDFNNLITAILGYSELMVRRLGADDPMRRHVAEVTHAAERAAALTRQLLAFSRKQLVEPRVLSLDQLVGDLEPMLRRLIGEHIELLVRRDPTAGMVKADPGRIEQVLINLVVNARDAMPGGGTLVIETANAMLDEEYARMEVDVTPGEYVGLSVSDTGTGMSEEVKAHAFEPFFTTKGEGKGTGLGLATCYGIVKQFGGHIALYSEPGLGTTMKVYLPRVDEAPVREAAAAEAPRGTETILLTEDDNRVRAVTARMLRAQGYTVLEAPDGYAALDLLKEAGDRVALLLSDVVLPRMGGRELAERARALRPGLPVLFASGYTDDVILQHQLLEHGVTLLQKPFTPPQLARRVREVLDRDRAP